MKEFKCSGCGQATNKMTGEPFTEAALRVHQTRWCPAKKADFTPNGAAAPVKTKKPKPTPITVAFCPCCGLNLAVLQAAINVGKGMR